MKRSRAHHRRGIAIVYLVVVFFVIMAFVALALDTARVLMVAHELQSAADASALAGAEWVQTDTTKTVSQATSIGAQNTAEGVPITIPTSDVTIGFWNRMTRTFDSSGTYTPNAVRVYASRMSGKNGALPFIFPNLVAGANSSNVQRSAIAMIGDLNIGVLVMNLHNPSSLQFKGTGAAPKITVELSDGNGKDLNMQGAVVVNSDSVNGFDANGNSTMDVQDLYLGGNEPGATAHLPATANLHTNQPPTSDPLAPYYTGTPPKPANAAKQDANGVWQSGYYTNQFSGGTLGPGLHYFMNGISGSFTASQGSLIFVQNGDINIGGNATITVQKMTGSNPYSMWTDLGISIWINQGNLLMNGKPTINNNGILYLTGKAPNGGLTKLGGNPGAVGSMLITDMLQFNGTGTITINKGPDNPKLEHVWLVK